MENCDYCHSERYERCDEYHYCGNWVCNEHGHPTWREDGGFDEVLCPDCAKEKSN